MEVSCSSLRNLHSTEGRIYKSNFWPSVLQRGWRHFQNCCWPVKSQWKLTDLMMMSDDWMFKICISLSGNRFTSQIFDFQFFKESGGTFRIIVDLPGPNGNWQVWWWWAMIECSRSVFRRTETGLQAKFLAFNFSEGVEAFLELLLACQVPMKTDRFSGDEQWWWTVMMNNGDGWWLNVQSLYFAEWKWVYKPNFWSSIPQRGWRHFQNCCWPVRPQWKLTGLMVNEMMRKWWWWRVRHMKFVCLICPQTKQLMCYAVYEMIQLHL